MLPRTVSDENKTGTPAFLISVPYTCPECAQGFGGRGVGGGRLRGGQAVSGAAGCRARREGCLADLLPLPH